jgi:hypothetical protein
MPNPEPHRLTAVEMAGRIEAGTLTAEAIVQSCLERISDREPVVRAWTHIAGDAALAAAREAKTDTLMKGVPFGIKDIFDTADMPTGYGSPIYTGCRPSFTRVRDPAARRRRGAARQDRHHRIRQPSSRADGEPAQSRLTRPAARRAARRPRSPISWCRWRSARKPAAR